ncbi:hypothetical protein ACFL0N_01055 [Pseudomonadota bacterium]
MNKALLILAIAAFSWSTTHAADVCDYSASTGTEIQFKTDDPYKKYGFPMFHASPGGDVTPYEVLGGKKAKVIGKAAGNYNILKYHVVLVEDCTRVYWIDTDGNLEPGDASSSGVVFLQQPDSEWKVGEKIDRMTDAKSCVVTPDSKVPFPMFHYHSSEGFTVGVVGGDFPGKPTTFRVDRNKAIAEIEGLSGSRAQALVAQIRGGGKKLLVGSYKWPKEYEVVKEFNLGGLVQQLDYCKNAVRK